MYVSGEGFFPLRTTFSAGKCSTGSSEEGCSLSLVELSSKRARNRAVSVSALFDGDVTAVVCNGVSGFGVYSSRRTVRNQREFQVKL